MVLFRNEGNTSTLFQFTGKTKILTKGSLSPNFNIKVSRNRRHGAKDILHKKGISNREFRMRTVLSGTDRFTNLTTLTALAIAETTIYLDTEDIYDTYNGTYVFDRRFEHDIDETKNIITIKFNLLEEAN